MVSRRWSVQPLKSDSSLGCSTLICFRKQFVGNMLGKCTFFHCDSVEFKCSVTQLHDWSEEWLPVWGSSCLQTSVLHPSQHYLFESGLPWAERECCNLEVQTVEREIWGLSYCIKRSVTKQKFHERKKGSEKEIALMQQLCCSVLQRCWHDVADALDSPTTHDYRSVIMRIKEAVLQMTAVLAKSNFLIALASGSSDSSAKTLYLSGGRLKENLSCRLHTANARACFACRVWCLL